MWFIKSFETDSGSNQYLYMVAVSVDPFFVAVKVAFKRYVFEDKERCAIVTLNVRDYDSSEVSDALFIHYGISTRPGAHCAPLMHQALGTVEQGAVRFSFSHYNTMEEIEIAVSALKELAQEE